MWSGLSYSGIYIGCIMYTDDLLLLSASVLDRIIDVEMEMRLQEAKNLMLTLIAVNPSV